jgi:hypothetical protein
VSSDVNEAVSGEGHSVWVRIDKRLICGPDSDYGFDAGDEACELEFASEEAALAHLNDLAADWDTDLVPAAGYVDFDGSTYRDDPDGRTFIFNGPVRDEERQGYATILISCRADLGK